MSKDKMPRSQSPQRWEYGTFRATHQYALQASRMNQISPSLYITGNSEFVYCGTKKPK